MRETVGNMWNIYNSCDLFVITTNGVITKSGLLVMGKGIAREARDNFPGLDARLAEKIRLHGEQEQSYWRYGFLAGKKLGIFQTKGHWADAADLGLIHLSTVMLRAWALNYPSAQINLNYPGIGAGRLGINDVYPIIRELPDNVTVWRR